MESISGEMEVVTGLIQKLIVENTTRKMDQNDYRKKYEGYVNWYAAHIRVDGLKKEKENREIKFDIFSGLLFELSELDGNRWSLTQSCSIVWWTTQRCITMEE